MQINTPVFVDEWCKFSGGREVALFDLREVDRLLAECAEDSVSFPRSWRRASPRTLSVAQDPPFAARALHLIAVTVGPIPRLVVPIFLSPLTRSSAFVEQAVVGKNDMRTIADNEVIGDLTPCLRKPSSSQTKSTGSMTTPFLMTHVFPGRRMPEGIKWRTCFLISNNHRVAGIVSALATDDDIGLIGEKIDTIFPLPSSPHMSPD